jgi:hypothetical protein
MKRLEMLRQYFDDWQSRGYDTRPEWFDDHIDQRINELTNVELLDLLDILERQK